MLLQLSETAIIIFKSKFNEQFQNVEMCIYDVKALYHYFIFVKEGHTLNIPIPTVCIVVKCLKFFTGLTVKVNFVFLSVVLQIVHSN